MKQMKINPDELVTRVPGTGDFITVDPEKCTMCERCLIICVMNLWKKKDGKVAIVDDYQSRCLECGACYQVCEADAIKFQYPAGGTGVVYEKG
ncbi:MAG: 4Fe-4S dicluster domain-containing protein [Candidatus Thorarchaeota archaeon]